MVFSLEAIRAKHGDCLLLHCGKTTAPDLYLIDGGTKGVYKQFLKKRLEKIRAGKEQLDIRLAMVSHVDDDHIKGILDMTAELRTQTQSGQAVSYRIRNLWHNSFDDVLGNGAKTLEAAGAARLGVASANEASKLPIPFRNEEAAFRLASVGQGRTLRDDAKLLNLRVNKPGAKGMVMAADKPIATPFTAGVELHILGPTQPLIDEFLAEWDKFIKKEKLNVAGAGLELAEFLDESAFNLASIVVLARAEGKEILLTGDARGDFVLESMEQAGMLKKNGKRRLDILKVPHHGSNRNVDAGFFRRLPADHYVISGDGEHGNPDVDTIEMIFEARKADKRKFTIHLTYDPKDYKADSKTKTKYPLAKLQAVLKAQKAAGRDFELNFPKKATDLSLRIDLLEPYAGL
jgi:hypothetical protein